MGRNPFCFSIFFEIIAVNLFSLRFKTTKSQTKNFIFCSVPFCFTFFFQHFSLFFSFITVVFVHFLFSSFYSSLCAFLPFSFPSFLHSFFFSISVFLFLPFSVSHVSLSVFFHRAFLRIFSFDLDLMLLFFLLYPFFSSSPYLFFLPKQIQNFLWSIF